MDRSPPPLSPPTPEPRPGTADGCSAVTGTRSRPAGNANTRNVPPSLSPLGRARATITRPRCRPKNRRKSIAIGLNVSFARWASDKDLYARTSLSYGSGRAATIIVHLPRGHDRVAARRLPIRRYCVGRVRAPLRQSLQRTAPAFLIRISVPRAITTNLR